MLKTLFASALGATMAISTASAHDEKVLRADSHAPIGVMGDHMHKEGEFMFSYRFMGMNMKGNREGTESVSPEEIATTVANPFFGQTGQPPTLRVVPTKMNMQMHMLGAMYAPTDWLTLMAMGSYKYNSMDHVTFQGGTGTTVLGTFNTKTSGFGDTKLSGLLRLLDNGTHHVHLNLGVSVPTGSITETDDVLAPNGMRPTLRLPYPMQLGSGTFDLNPGVTYTGKSGGFGWGAQAIGTVRLGRNHEGYSLGDGAEATAWASYSPRPWISFSGRVKGSYLGTIDGQDPMIVAPVQTAVPGFQGGKQITLLGGINLVGEEGFLRNQRLALEVGVPVYRNLNGPQLETDWSITLGYQIAF
ncbi:transporter [Rhodobacteraceae bacterium NNCM2]|nr:transporter [Coraliihabitans acroporae]